MLDDMHIALLRGINVGGRNKVPMADLRDMFADLGYRDARTYIQSGNIVFRAAGSEHDIVRAIRAGIHDTFDLDIPVVVRTSRAFAAVSHTHPLSTTVADPRFLMVAFLDRSPEAPVEERIDASAYGPDRFEQAGREIFLAYPNGSGRSKLNHTLFERRLGVVATIRNWRTVRALADMLSQ